VNDADLGELERAAYVFAMAGFDVPQRPAFIPNWWPSKDYWPVPDRAYVYSMLASTYGMAAIKHARTLPLLRQH
jgi:hypothetical protein